MTDQPQDHATGTQDATQSVRDIIAHVADKTCSRKPVMVGSPSDPVVWSVTHIAKNFDGILRVGKIACGAGMSKFHFIRRFHREVGMTPGLFIQRYRICQAMGRLTGSTTAIHVIARQVGYTDPAAFSRAFLKTIGTQPNIYRQECQPCDLEQNVHV